MLGATSAYLDENVKVFSAVPIIVTYKNNLTNVSNELKAAAQAQDAAQLFIGRSKDELKRALSEKLDILDDTVEA